MHVEFLQAWDPNKGSGFNFGSRLARFWGYASLRLRLKRCSGKALAFLRVPAERFLVTLMFTFLFSGFGVDVFIDLGIKIFSFRGLEFVGV